MKLLRRLWITIAFWGIARLIPAIIGAFLPNFLVLSVICFCAFLPLGWRSADKISAGEHPTTIRLNLGFFIFLELSNIASALMALMDYSSGYGSFAPGYIATIILLLVGSVAYIILCSILISKTKDNEKLAEDESE
jgi:hypothetical protein